MNAIYKRELASYFRSMTGYVLIAFLIIFAGIYFMVYNMYQGYPYFSYALSSMLLILLIAVPVLTMRSFSEEKKSKTDQLLFTAPVKISRIVMGKYLAMVTVFLIPVLIFCLFPLIIKTQGTAYLLTDYCSILQFFLLGCVFIAVGMFCSSLTESPVIAAVSTFGASFVLYLWGHLVDYLPDTAVLNALIVILICVGVAIWIYHMTKNLFLAVLVGAAGVITCIVFLLIDTAYFEGLLASVLEKFNVLTGFDDAAFNSIFNLSAVVMQLTVAGVFVFLTMQSIEKRRWS